MDSNDPSYKPTNDKLTIVLLNGIQSIENLIHDLKNSMSSVMLQTIHQEGSTRTCFENLQYSQANLNNNLNTESLQEMYDKSYELHKLNHFIMTLLNKIERKSEEIMALQISLVALEAASLSSLSGGPIGWIIGGTATAAAIAVTVAKDQLQNELQEATELYVSKAQEFAARMTEQGQVDLDSETQDFFLKRLNVLSRAMINVHSHINGKMPVWQLGLALLESLEAKMQSHRQVVRSGLFQYYDIDYEQLMEMLNVIDML